MTKTVYIHIGLHKTATTTLQRNIFNQIKNVNYVNSSQIKGLLETIRHDELTNKDIDSIRNKLYPYLNEEKSLISYEGLSGSPFRNDFKHPFSILNDLRRIFSDNKYEVKIIIGLREQVSLFTSLYLQYIHEGGFLSAYNFFNKSFYQDSHEESLLSVYNFKNYLDVIEENFSIENLYVYFYENIKKNYIAEINNLLKYIDAVDEKIKVNEANDNKGYGKKQVAIARRLNKYFKSSHNPEGLIPIFKIPKVGKFQPRLFLQNKISYKLHYEKYELPQDIQDYISNYFKDSNNELQNYYGYDLPEEYI